MAKDEEDDLLPDKDAAKGFYAKYEPKEILGRSVVDHQRTQRCVIGICKRKHLLSMNGTAVIR